MKKLFLLTVLCASLSTAAFGFLGFGGKKSDMTELQKEAKKVIKAKNIRVVIGSKSTGGDTYQSSSIVAQQLGEVLGKNVKVDAVGAFSGMDAIKRVKDGSTIMIFHDMAYLGYLYGKAGYTNIFEDYQIGPLLATNPGNAFSAAKGSKYNTVEDVIEAAGHGEKVRVAIQPGGVSEIGFSAMKNAVKIKYPGMEENVVAVNTGSQADKNQQLFDGLADIINSSVQANEQFNYLPADDQKAMKFIWLTASSDTLAKTTDKGFGTTSKDQLMQYGEPNVVVKQDSVTNFTFDKDFYVLYNKDMAPEIVDLYDRAIKEAFQSEEMIKQLSDAFFVPKHKTTAEANKYLKEKSAAYSKIIKSIKK